MESSRLHSTLADFSPFPHSPAGHSSDWKSGVKIVGRNGSRGGGGVGRPGRGEDRRHRLVPARVPRGGHAAAGGGLSRASKTEAAFGGGADAEPAEEAASAVRQGAIHK